MSRHIPLWIPPILQGPDTTFECRTNARGSAVVYPLQEANYTLSVEYAPGIFFNESIRIQSGRQHRRITVGRDETEPVTIYPNPFDDTITVLLSEEPSGMSFIKLYEPTGYLLRETSFYGLSKTLQLPQLADGIYIMLVSVDGKKYVRKVGHITR